MAMHSGTDEPNLIPLLDLILQLVMFFMAITSFAKENISDAVRLPTAQAAKPIDDEELHHNELVYLNVEENGDMRVRSFTDENGTQWYLRGKIDDVVTDDAGNVVPGPDGKPQHEMRLRRERFDKYFQRLFESRAQLVKRNLGADANDDGKVKSAVAKTTMIVLRAHQLADYRDIYEILSKCRHAGFSKMQLRATMETPHS
jgi:biopolymer transport protein ExbD